MRITECVACACHLASPQEAWMRLLSVWVGCGPGGSLRTEAEGPTPRRSCPPGGASCAWRWPHPPPACTAASLSLTPSAGSRPGARAAGPPAAGPGPVRGTREGDIRQGLRGSAGMGGTPQPCLSSPPAPQQTELKCLLVWGSGRQPSPVQWGDHQGGMSTAKPRQGDCKFVRSVSTKEVQQRGNEGDLR